MVVLRWASWLSEGCRKEEPIAQARWVCLDALVSSALSVLTLVESQSLLDGLCDDNLVVSKMWDVSQALFAIRVAFLEVKWVHSKRLRYVASSSERWLGSHITRTSKSLGMASGALRDA